MTMQEEGHHSQVQLPNGVHWEPESCWDDIYDAIDNCRVLCYVVGGLSTSTVMHAPSHSTACVTGKYEKVVVRLCV